MVIRQAISVKPYQRKHLYNTAHIPRILTYPRRLQKPPV